MSNIYTIPMKTKDRPNAAENINEMGDDYLIPLNNMDKPNADEIYSEIQTETVKQNGNEHHTTSKGRLQEYKISRRILLVILISICLLVISSLVSLYLIITTWTRIKGADYAGAVTQCPDGWLVYKGSCYQFGNLAAQFKKATRYCFKHGAYLVHIDDQLENQFLRSFLMNLKEEKHWIGLTDQDIEGVWKWVDNNETVNFTAWRRNDPNGGLKNNCAAIRGDYGYKWVDDPCSYHFNPICEKRIEDAVVTDG